MDSKTRKMALVLGYAAALAFTSWAALDIITIIITFTD